MTNQEIVKMIAGGETFLGIELGSTRIKAVLVSADRAHAPIAGGSHTWENRLENGIWTYRLSDVDAGLRACYQSLRDDVRRKYGVSLKKAAAIGVSAMMHGYLPFGADGEQLAEFRTWRNTNTARAAAELTELFRFNIPQRWSVAHLYQAMLDREPHVERIDFLTTLAGYVHLRLTGEKVLGIGDASGMFPIDSTTNDYDEKMLSLFGKAAKSVGFAIDPRKIFPRVLRAGESAGTLTEVGARYLDPSGELNAGIPLCPPEGDAGTGMTATASVSERTGNVSAGTSIFSMVVLEKPLSRVYPEIDLVTTPSGDPVAMVHCNNCSSDIDAWAGLLSSFAGKAGASVDLGGALSILFEAAAAGDADCGGLC
ncbi:MAG: FGGY family carbohydrate kinase, partial [Eubacterium sp.]|nr:FGGY family carbohydrate kinase [Eubacterium sp.]